MLGPHYRFTIQNSFGTTLAANAVTILPRRWKFGTDGSITNEASGVTDILAQTTTVANTLYKTGTTQDNTTNKYIGGVFEIKVIAPSAGSLIITLDRSVDGGTTWPDNGRGVWVNTFTFTGVATQYKVLEVE